MWVFEVAFGQANLWLDGACNYLWNVAFGLAFIWHYVREFLYDDLTYKKLAAVPFALLSFVVGAYGESGSAAFIFMAMLLMALSCLWQRKGCKMMLLADMILLRGILEKGNYKKIAVCALVLLFVATPFRLVAGVTDIHQTYKVMLENEEYLKECAQKGITEVRVPLVYPETMYSAPWGMDYLSTTDPHNYPNDPMNRYFGVEILLGQE